MLIVDLDVAFAGIGQVLGRIETGDGRERGDALIEAFDHAISSGPGRDQAMVEVCVGTELELGG